jgi:hypothetical protein
MRTVALAALLAAASTPGCNWVFGLDGTESKPPPDGIDAPPLKTVRLTHHVASTVSETSVTLDTPPLTVVDDMVLVGGMPGDVMNPLEPAPLTPAGYIDVPDKLRAGMWRLVYRLADEPTVEHEVQWSGTDQHITEPVFGRLDRVPVSADQLYRITVPGVVVFNSARIMTTGIWTETGASAVGNAASLVFSSATSMSGPLGVPDPVRGDQVVLCDFMNLKSVGCAVTSITLMPTGTSEPTTPPAWDTTPALFQPGSGLTVVGTNSPNGRLSVALGTLYTSGGAIITIEVGAVPTLGIYSFTQQPRTRISKLDVVRPVMLTFAEGDHTATIPYVHPALSLPKVMYARYVNDRVTTNGAHLTSAIQTVTPLATTGPTSCTFAASVPKGPALDGTLLDFDNKPMGLGTAPIDLTWTDDTAGPSRSDDHVVTLYKLVGSTIERIHVWTSIETKVTIDPAIFDAGTKYVFEIAGRSGIKHPLVDTTMVMAPFGMSSVFTGTFTK